MCALCVYVSVCMVYANLYMFTFYNVCVCECAVCIYVCIQRLEASVRDLYQ